MVNWAYPERFDVPAARPRRSPGGRGGLSIPPGWTFTRLRARATPQACFGGASLQDMDTFLRNLQVDLGRTTLGAISFL